MITAALLLVAQAATPTPAPTPEPQRPSLTVLPQQSGERAAAPTTTLADIARRIKLRLPPGGGNRITNEDLEKLVMGVELTTARPSSDETGADLDAPTAAGTSEQDQKKEYWQSRYWDALRRVEELEAREKFLQGEVGRLENDFYARDDPGQRDGVVKPAWDKALIDLRSVQEELQNAREAPGDVLEEARRDGAQPGWFRESAPEASAGESEARPEPER